MFNVNLSQLTIKPGVQTVIWASAPTCRMIPAPVTLGQLWLKASKPPSSWGLLTSEGERSHVSAARRARRGGSMKEIKTSPIQKFQTDQDTITISPKTPSELDQDTNDANRTGTTPSAHQIWPEEANRQECWLWRTHGAYSDAMLLETKNTEVAGIEAQKPWSEGGEMAHLQLLGPPQGPGATSDVAEKKTLKGPDGELAGISQTWSKGKWMQTNHFG